MFVILQKFQVLARMTSLRPDLKGAERAKFFQALIEKINNVCDGDTIGENVNRLVNTFAHPNQSSQPPVKMKRCQTLAERPSVSCAKIDDGRREYVVRRVKFAKRALDSRRQNLRTKDDNAVVTVVDSQSHEGCPSSTTRFENTKRKLFEIEKEKLKELYGRSNSRERADDVKNDKPMIADRRCPQICDKIPTPPPPEALEETCSKVAAAPTATVATTCREICLPALEYNSTRSDSAKETRSVEKSNDETDEPTTAIALGISENITTSNQESNGALRSIDDNEAVSTNTLSTQISNRRSRRRQLRVSKRIYVTPPSDVFICKKGTSEM